MAMLNHFLAVLVLSYRVEYKLLGFIHLQNTTSDEWETQNSIALRVCQNIVNQSQEKMFYAIGLHSDPFFVQFIQHLQNASIQTIVISQVSKLTSSVFSYHSKNMIFIVNDAEELLDLIFYSISQQKPLALNGIGFSTDSVHYQTDGGIRSRNSSSHHCIEVDGQNLWSRKGKLCHKTIGLSSAELRDGSRLSDSVFNATRSLYINKIWNSKNHLIFFLKNLRYDLRESSSRPQQSSRHLKSGNKTLIKHENDPFSSVIFCFKFFWRFFKGRKAIICHPLGCEKYDPFTESLISFGGENDDFFDFSLTNMHKKPMTAYRDYASEPSLRIVNPETWHKWTVFHETAIKHLATALNCTLYYAGERTPHVWLHLFEEEDGLRYDINLHTFAGNGVSLREFDISKIDLAVSIDTSALCIATPHSAFMSQGLVIFVSFTPIVWALTLITFFLFTFLQYLFQYSQREFFDQLYSEAERDNFRGTSSMLTVYAYFVCGSPPSLTLGRLVTGKMIFTIFSFSALIMSTAFLGSMTTLLSDRVLYSEIDSLDMLEKSDFFIETFLDEKFDIDFFDGLSESLRVMCVSNFLFYQNEYFMHSLLPNSSNTLETVQNTVSKSISNAVLVSVPYMSNPRDTVTIEQFITKEQLEYHLMKECLMMYPLTLPILKNSIFYDKLNQVIAHMLETGHARRILDDTSYDFVRWGNLSTGVGDGEPRAYKMNDLQSAFIGLGVGLFLSCIALIGEISIDLFQSFAPVKFPRRSHTFKRVEL